MFDVFRFAWFAVRTFIGVILLVITLYAALWLFVKILSAAPCDDDPGAGLRRVNSYNARAAAKDRVVPAIPQDRTARCSESRDVDCDRR
jgi:hypothetical protein